MESLYLSICHLVDNGLFSGIQLPGSVTISHLFHADEAMFIGEWSEENLKVILNALKCFFLASELQQLTDLATLLDSVILNNSKDRWYCDLSGDGEFRVKKLRNFIDDKYLPSHTEATRWVKLVPIKVNIFVWRARRDCLPTRTNLEHRGVDLFPVCVEACLSLVEFRPPRMVDISEMANLESLRLRGPSSETFDDF
nr:RNA-directed DNA polymerase, eukaryota [Tanacetum cinerariifolium]